MEIPVYILRVRRSSCDLSSHRPTTSFRKNLSAPIDQLHLYFLLWDTVHDFECLCQPDISVLLVLIKCPFRKHEKATGHNLLPPCARLLTIRIT